jgi:regulator of Ty1 transposition protein 103
VNAANQDYDKLMDPAAVAPSAPVHAARLNGLLKTLANAEGAVAESIKARKLLIEGLEKILDANRSALAADENQFAEISARKAEIDQKKHDVEESIMRGFATTSDPGTPVGDGSPGIHHSPVTPAPEPDRPEVEALTPPGYPQPAHPEPIPEFELDTTGSGNQNGQYQQTRSEQHTVGSDLLSSLSTPYSQPRTTNSGSVKKRKLNTEDGFLDLGGDAMDGLDADVAEMLRRDSGS